MSANINRNEQRGTDSFVSRKEIPWRGLGTIVQEAMTSEEAVKLCNADFTVALAPNFARLNQILTEDIKNTNNVIKLTSNGTAKYYNTAQSEGTFSTYRTDNNVIFGSVGSKYTVIQNIEAFQFIDNIVETGEAVIETAGVLGKGERMFVTAKLPSYITLSNGDIIEKYIFITNSHDGSGMVTAALTNIRIVCNNTLMAALCNCTNKIQFKHTKNVKNKLEQGRELMQLSNKFSKEFEEALTYLKNKPLTQEEIIGITYQLVLSPQELALVSANNNNLAKVKEVSTRKKNTIVDIARSIEFGPGQESFKNSGLWLYNGITSYLGNTKIYSNSEDRLISLTEGSEAKLSQTAFNLILNV